MTAFVYTELQISLPFSDTPWRELNPVLLDQPGLLNKTWLSGAGNHSVGGFYTFSELRQAQSFVNDYFPAEAKKIGAPQTTRIFDGIAVKEASIDMNSPHFGTKASQEPGAYVYTEVQVGLPFGQAPWKDLNPILKAQPGLLSKTWLSGISSHTLGGLYAFDTLENAQHFAQHYFPTEAAQLKAAFTTRVFDARATKEASLEMRSPFYQ